MYCQDIQVLEEGIRIVFTYDGQGRLPSPHEFIELNQASCRELEVIERQLIRSECNPVYPALAPSDVESFWHGDECPNVCTCCYAD